jgi:hypothetical protein
MIRVCIALFAMTLLAETARADGSVSPCVDALEQVLALQTSLPVYKVVGPESRHYIDDADRPAEIARLRKIIHTSCSADPQARKSEEAEAARLHSARSDYCAGARDALSRMEQKGSRDPADVVADQRKRVAENCPAVSTDNAWLVAPLPQT